MILARGATATALLVGLPAVTAVVIAGGLVGVRIAVASVRAAGRRRRARQPETIDPYAVPDPWRRYVRESLTAEGQFDQAVQRCQPGPLREHLDEVARRVHDGVRECWRVAHLGAALDTAVASLRPEAIGRELRRVQDESGHRVPGAETHAHTGSAGRDQTEAALAAELQAARRLEAASQRAIDRLRVLTAQLNTAVASAVELSLGTIDPGSATELAGDVNSVVGEIEALRKALEETAAPSARGEGTSTLG